MVMENEPEQLRPIDGTSGDAAPDTPEEVSEEQLLVMDCILGNRDAQARLARDYERAVFRGAAYALAHATGPVSASAENLVKHSSCR